MKRFGIFIELILFAGFMAGGGWLLGKRAADHWYAKYPCPFITSYNSETHHSDSAPPTSLSADGSIIGYSTAGGGTVCSLSITHKVILYKGHTWEQCATLLMEDAAERWRKP